ncbi:MAG: HlyD family efflux transporter periplasmic adaptor subunit [Clostridia bacterium]|nr:HlyD family efflux transporter periplasmic adaptor subunit [Clostridia bacterium]
MKKFLLYILIFCLIVFQLWNIIIFFNPPIKTEMVLYDTLSNSAEYDGIIIRDESVLIADSTGVLDSVAAENTVVKKGKHVASLYTGQADPEIQEKLRQINARIAELTGAQGNNLVFENDQAKIEGNISTRVTDMIVSVNDKDLRHVRDLKNDFNVLINKKNMVSTDGGSVVAILDGLEAEKARYEAALSSSRKNLYAPKAGIYSTVIDGFEQVLNSNAMKSMTVDSFDTLYDTEPTVTMEAGQPICKIVDNVEWHVAIKLDSGKASEMYIGQKVYVKIGSSAEEHSATVSYISPVSGDKCIIGVTSTEYSEEALRSRKTKVTLVTNKYSGIKIPVKALRVNNGIQGVYTVTEGLMKFKKVEILYKDANYAVVRADITENGYLLLYDEVVIDAKNVGENISVR